MPAALCTDLAKPPPAAAPGSELWLGSERAAASLITHGSLCRALAGSLTLPRRPVRPRPRQSRPDLIPPLCSFASLPPCGNTPLGALRPPPSLTQPLRPHFPLLRPKPGLSVQLAEGLEKPRSTTAGSGRQQPISCAKRPGRNSFPQLPPSLLLMGAPRPGPIQAASDGRTQGRTHPLGRSHSSTNALTDTLAEAVELPQTWRPMLAPTCAHRSQTHIHAPHLSVSGDREWTQTGGKMSPLRLPASATALL